jgi:hypothetical protein
MRRRLVLRSVVVDQKPTILVLCGAQHVDRRAVLMREACRTLQPGSVLMSCSCMGADTGGVLVQKTYGTL